MGRRDRSAEANDQRGRRALLREKFVACMSKEMIVIVDSNKVVDFLGRFYLPVRFVLLLLNPPCITLNS